MITQKELTDEKIGELIDIKIENAKTWNGTNLKRDIKRAYQYLNRELPAPQKSNGSRWVAPHTYNSTEYMRSQVGDTFSYGTGIVQFDPSGPNDEKATEIATEYANFVFYKQNRGDRILRDAIFDGLIAGNGIVKVYWDVDYDYEQLRFKNVTDVELDGWERGAGNVYDFKAKPNANGTYDGVLVTREEKSQVRVEVIPPEDFFIEQAARELSEEYFCMHKVKKTLNWVLTTYPKMKSQKEELLKAAAPDITDDELASARHNMSWSGDMDRNESQEELRLLTIYECYSRFMRDDDLTVRLYKVLRCGSVTIDIEPVDELPFCVFTPIPRSHKFYGESFVKTVMPTQDIMTAAQRAVVDHTMLTVSPRWTFMTGSLVRPQEFFANRHGGGVEYRPGTQAPVPLATPAMNPAIGSMMETLERMNEAITGISSTSIGLNDNVINKQNSSASLEIQTGNGQIRQKEIARNFAWGLLCPMFEKIYRLVVQFERRENIQIVVGDDWVPINPWDWAKRRAATASAHLGYGERQAKAQEIMMVGEKMAANPWLAKQVGPEGAREMARDVWTLLGYKARLPRYMPVAVKDIPPEQPSPMEIAEIELKQADAKSKLMLAEAELQKVAQHAGTTAEKMRLAEFEAKLHAMTAMADTKRKDADVANRIDTSQREMTLQENPPANTETRSIISP